jgi:hypothetical protein
MTVVDGRRVNATGRATGRLRTNRHTKIAGQFAPRLIDMLRSPAFRALSLSAHRVLARVEIELADHGGQDNGRLPVTFQDFEDYGIHRHAIGPALAECQALGFLEITQRGRAGNGEWRAPNLFRLTYRHMRSEPATDEWKRIESIESAEAIARAARTTAEHKDHKPEAKRRSAPARHGLVA